ncbi:DUF771 domain-containing protein [Lysinibacillus endophyticus]|uniref:DUF771 domain-containing protein n=1 Tax=Ureibacillus endophyticus TaxID=1978490 RepID=UPI0031367A3A
MDQHIQVQLSIPVPQDMIIITKVELERLKKADLSGQYWTMMDLEKKINKKQEWIKDNILYKFRGILDVKNGGFVYYPEKKGQTWSFHAPKMAQFLEHNFSSIFTNL